MDKLSDVSFFPGMQIDDVQQLHLVPLHHTDGTRATTATGKIVGLYRAYTRDRNLAVVPQLWAIVAQSTNTAIVELEREMKRAQDDARDSRVKLDEQVRKVVDLGGARDSWKKTCDELRDKIALISDARDNAVTTWNKLETDLAKVRKFFGEKAFNEALEAK